LARVRIGFIGCGGRAAAHMAALARRADVEVVGVADVVAQAAEQAGARLGVPAFTDHRQLLERPLDAVVISVPVFAHGVIEMDCIARGVPMLIEKPVARDLPTAERIAEALRAKGLWAAVGYQLRYGQGVRQARAFLAGRAVSVVEGHYWCGTNRQGAWQNDWKASGGQLVEQATHTVDLMRFLVGEVEEVYALQARRVLTQITSPDSYVVALRFAGGALGALTTSWVYDGSDWSHANVVHVVVDGALVRLDGQGAHVSPATQGGLPEVPSMDLYDAFVSAVQTGVPRDVLSPYEDALATLRVTLAANESAARGRPVRVRDAVGA
jgi:predicted dehydrogenase